MYYSAVLKRDQRASDKVVDIAHAEDMECKFFTPESFQGSQMIDLAVEQGWDTFFPLVMIGDTLLASGEEAWIDLHEHFLDNPHVHWEAGDEGDRD